MVGDSVQAPRKDKTRTTTGSSDPRAGLQPKETNTIARNHLCPRSLLPAPPACALDCTCREVLVSAGPLAKELHSDILEGGHPCLTHCTPTWAPPQAPVGSHGHRAVPSRALSAQHRAAPSCPSLGGKLLEFQTSCLMIHSSSPGDMGNKSVTKPHAPNIV